MSIVKFARPGRRCAYRSFVFALLIAAFGLAGIEGSVHGADDAPRAVRWRTGAAELGSLDRAGVVAAVDALAVRADERHVVIQLRKPITAADRRALSRAGVELQKYLSDHAYFARLSATANAETVAALDLVVGAQPIAARWKLHPYFIDVGVPQWVVVPRNDEREGAERNPIIAVYVLFHPDVDLSLDAWLLTAAYGGRVRSELKTVNGLVVEMPYLMVDGFAAEDAVMYIEPALPKFSEKNNSNRTRVGADAAQEAPYGLDGAGVTVLVYDGGSALASHGDFGGRLTVRDTSGLSDHATHVAGTIGGDGAGSGGLYRGMAPGVTIESYGFEQEGGLSQGFLYTDPGDIEADYGEAIGLHGVDLSNNSIGTNTAPNGYPCDWEGNYGVTSMVIDAIVRGGVSDDGSPFRVVWANGNERQVSTCFGVEGYPGEYHTTAPPACAKNHIAVGALNSNDDSMTDFSSWGPADDGRLKPDISAPGCQSTDDNDVTSTSSSGGYTGKCGTSMAAPTVTGMAALLLQDYRLQYPGEPDFRNSTLKALLAHTAVDLGNAGPDYQYGYGSVRVMPAIDTMRAGNFIEGEVAAGETVSVLVLVGPGEPELKITLAWDDPPGMPNVLPALVNDLDLEVFDGGSGQLFPWTLDPANPANPAVRTQADHANNIEQVVLAGPAPGVYRVDIVGFDVPEGPQAFSLVATPVLVNCSSAGVVSADRASFACEATTQLRVVDCDLNTDDGAIETVTVLVASDSEPAGEMIVLTETAAETAAFEAPLTVSGTDAPGVLLVAPGDDVTITYVDADDGAGGTDVDVVQVVPVDCTAPLATSVTTSDVQPRSARVVVSSNEPARVTVRYGTDCAALTDEKAAFAFATDQTLNLSGLTEDTAYFFAVDLEDQAGNTSTDDNGGLCHTFATPDIPNFFTQQGASSVDGLSITYTPNGTIDGYAACRTLIGTLPTDPAGGATISLSDDDSESMAIGGDASVVLYGDSYETVYVGSNGYLTFTGPDSDYTDSLGDHFGTPRVSGLFDDLNPSAGGSVSWKQLGDRIAVTWQSVPEYSTSNSNTFQIEMFFDGRIRQSWLGMAATDGITGLSEGVGLSPDFLDSLLADSPVCEPMPPFASDTIVEATTGSTTPIALPGFDDGEPDPPGALAYVVTSLPAQPLRDPVTAQVIGAGDLPYTLAGDGDSVEYVAGSSFTGLDSFTYLVDDGGVPPSGGPSNIGTVEVLVGTAPTVIHEFTFDADPGWTTEGQWAFGSPTGGGSYSGDPTGGYTGANVYGYNLAGDYVNNLSPTQYLTTPALDCSGVISTELSFRRWLGVESSTYDHANVQISTDGTSWSTVWSHSGSSFSESSWSEQVYDISAWADDQPTVYLRWGMGTTDGSVTYPGWNIDDVRIIGSGISPSIPGDINGDGSVGFADLSSLLNAWGACPGCPEDLDGNGSVGFSDLNILLANWGGGAGEAAGSILAGLDDPNTREAGALEVETPAVVTRNVGVSAPAEDAVDVFVNDGVVAPVEHGGVLSIDRGYLQRAWGELVIEIAGVRPVDEYDVLVVAGPATLDGLLRVRFDEHFAPMVGDRFAVVLADEIAGDFAEVDVVGSVDASWELRIADGAATLAIVDAVDDPAPRAVPLNAIERFRADLDGDGVVDVRDVQRLLDWWGPLADDSREAASADVNGDGVVDGADLERLLDAWTRR